MAGPSDLQSIPLYGKPACLCGWIPDSPALNPSCIPGLMRALTGLRRTRVGQSPWQPGSAHPFGVPQGEERRKDSRRFTEGRWLMPPVAQMSQTLVGPLRCQPHSGTRTLLRKGPDAGSAARPQPPRLSELRSSSGRLLVGGSRLKSKESQLRHVVSAPRRRFLTLPWRFLFCRPVGWDVQRAG